MIGYKQPMLRAKAPIVKQDFYFIHETDRSVIYGQVKMPSLADYDREGIDDEDADVRLCLDRWGDLRVPERLIAA
jgi:hypothetical protein